MLNRKPDSTIAAYRIDFQNYFAIIPLGFWFVLQKHGTPLQVAFECHWLELTVTACASNRLSIVVNIFELLQDHF